MIGLILAGGFGKRMGEYGESLPKGLLKIRGVHVVDHIMKKFGSLSLEKVYLSTNKKYEKKFRQWALLNDVELFVEPSTNDSDKLGSMGGIKHFLKVMDIDDDILVFASDNILSDSLVSFISSFDRKNYLLGVYESIKDFEDYGTVLFDDNNRVTSFSEKNTFPISTYVATCIFLIPKNKQHLIFDSVLKLL